MKKLVAVLALIAVMVCAVACGSFPEIKDAKKNLKNEDYEVRTIDDEDKIEAFLAEIDVDADGVEEVLHAIDDEDIFVALYCEDSKAADEVFESMQDYYEGDFEDDAEKEDIDIDEYKVEKLGNTVIFGHEDMIKVAKG